MSDYTAKILGSCADLGGLVEYGIVALQDINKRREAVDLPVIYFLQPEKKLVKKMAMDFDKGSDEKRVLIALYTRCYCIFTSRLPKDMVLQVLSKEERFKESVRRLTEVYIDFIAYESRVFTFHTQNALMDILTASEETIMTVMEQYSEKLAGLCLSLNEKPNIRYRAPRNTRKSSEKYCNLLASFLGGTSLKKGDLDMSIERLPNWQSRSNPGTVLMLDRDIDPIAPLLHDVTYQAVVHDALDIQDNVLKLDSKTSYVVDENDVWWRDYRHRHINEVLRKLTEASNEIKEKNQVASGGQDSDNWDSKGMLNKVRDYPSYREFTKQYKKHTLILKKLYAYLKPLTKEVLGLQMDMATQMDTKGTRIKHGDYFKRLIAVCEDETIREETKVRCVLIYIATNGGISQRELKRVLKLLPPTAVAAVNGFQKFGINTGEPDKTRRFHCTGVHRESVEEHMKKNQEWANNQWRYVPLIYGTVKSMIQDTLDEKDFPYIKPPALKTQVKSVARVASRRKRGPSTRNDEADVDKPRFIVFMLGGLCPSEMRAMYRLSVEMGVDIVIGSPGLLTAKQYVDALVQSAQS
uniref:Uncharacterized protein n=1 Tax=Amorphochlora amoebiformis TaxID=1561963 RepID=A0A7S0GSH8_9EUKA